MNSSRMASHSDPSRFLKWPWLALLFSIVVCGAIFVLSSQQREFSQRSQQTLTRLRLARIDLGKGVLHLVLAGDPQSPFNREEGIAYLEQAIASLQPTVVRVQRDAVSPVETALLSALTAKLAHARTLLEQWRAAEGGDRTSRELELRLAIHELDRSAQEVDALNQQELRTREQRTEWQFTLILALAVGFLGAVCVVMYFAARNERAAVNALRASEARIRLMGDNLPDCYVYRYVYTPEGISRFDYISAGVARVHGISVEEALRDARVLLSQMDPSIQEAHRAAEAKSARELTDFELELPLRRADGERRVLQVRSHPQRLPDGTLCWDGFATDITDQIKTAEALQQQDTRLQEMSAMAHVGAWEFDPVTGQGTWSEEIARIYDLEPAVATSRDVGLSVYRGESRLRIETAIDAAIEHGRPYDLELEMITPAGNRKWVHTRGRPVFEQGRVVRLRGSFQDITDRKRVELALRESEARFRTLFEQAADGIFIYSADNQYEDVNSQGLRMLGYSREEFIGLKVGALTASDRQDDVTAFGRRIRGGETVVTEWQFRRKDGSLIDVDVATRQLSDGRGLSLVRDVSERKRAAARTALHHAVTIILADAAPILPTLGKIVEEVSTALHWEVGGCWLIDRPSKKMRSVVHWTMPGLDFGEFAEQTRTLAFDRGQGLPGQIWESAKPLWIENLEQTENFPRQHAALANHLRSGIGFPLSIRGEPQGVMEFFCRTARATDPAMLALFTALGAQIGQFLERQRLEEQFRQAQKMDALGTLAGGIAHDFNNILAAMMMCTSLARMSVSGNPQAEEHLDRVLQAGGRAADLVRQILTFSRRQEQQRDVLRMDQVLAEAAKLLRATIPTTIELSVVVAGNLPPVLADSTQIHQVLMNVGTNAWHAMRGRPGRITMSAERVVMDGPMAEELEVNAGEFVRIAVHDTGHGMDAATKERIFEPFFTTKPRGEGTGLGLSVVHGIVRSHGGAIVVDSAVGVGTTFQLYFPVTSAGGAVVPATAAPALARGNGELIVVVDDEATIALATRILLEGVGYRVEMWTDTTGALRRVEALREECALVLTDYTLPGMTGLQLATQLRDRQLRMPIILTTGYGGSLKDEALKAAGISAVLPKPATIEAMTQLIHDVLVRSGAAAKRPPSPPL